jgi:cellulose synthase/poly-beta-1,6-N-acetylglucosamine synthase-like glycosyltransferase
MNGAGYVIQWLILAYFVLLNGSYLLLNLLSLFILRRRVEEQVLDNLPQVYSGLEIPISVLIPAFNEAPRINAAVHAVLKLTYSELEVIVINDGSTDDTMSQLCQEFALLPFPEAYRVRLPTQPGQKVYRSTRFQNLRVIDKAHGGKADALNCGINAARFPLFCCVNAGAILQRDSLQRIVKPFLNDTTVVSAGGTVRIAHNCQIENGFLSQVVLPRNLTSLFQVVEYLRAYLFGRLGWSWLNGMLIISGTFALFQKETVVEAGGYSTQSLACDMDLVVRIHRLLRKQQRAYKVSFVPEPICWEQTHDNIAALFRQRMSGQQGLVECLFENKGLLFSRHGGVPGWVSFPFFLFFECFGPLLELLAYGWMFFAFLTGIISGQILVAFLFVAIGLGILLSASGLLLEEMSLYRHPRKRHLLLLIMAVIFENFGYRQMNTFWRLFGLLRALFGILNKAVARA